MELTEIAHTVPLHEPIKSRVFTATDRDGISYAFVIKRVGTDGGDHPLWLGRMKPSDGESIGVALVTTEEGDIIAVNTAEPSMAIMKAVDMHRKAYGKSLAPALSWETKRYNGMRLE